MATNTKVSLYNLRSGLVLDRSVFVTESADEMGLTLELIRANSAKSLTVVDNARTFFTSDNMITLIKADNSDYLLIAEHAKINILGVDAEALRRAEQVRSDIVKAMTPPIPPYTFQDVPHGWSIQTDLIITAGDRPSVRRCRFNPDSDGTSHSMSVRQLQKLWSIASRRWANETGISRYVSVNAGGDTRNAEVEPTRVTIGCQKVRRYELEQLAVHFGWAFPEVK